MADNNSGIDYSQLLLVAQLAEVTPDLDLQLAQDNLLRNAFP